MGAAGVREGEEGEVDRNLRRKIHCQTPGEREEGDKTVSRVAGSLLSLKKCLY